MMEAKEAKETIANIVAEYRSDADKMDCGGLYQPTTIYVRQLLNRIEAARKREHDELVYSFDPTKALRSKAPDPSAYAIEGMKGFEEWNRNKEPSVGNAAELREALIETKSAIARCMDILNKIPDTCGYGGLVDDAADELCALREEHLKTALSAPPRNCDVGTAEAQTKRYDVYCYDHRNMENCCGDCPLKQAAVCEIAFGQMPYEAEEGGANGK